MSKNKKQEAPVEQEKPKTKYDRKMEARRREAARQKREALIFRIICIAVLVAIIGTAGYFGVRQFLDFQNATQKPYVAIGSHELTQLEYDYHYNTTVNNYINAYSYYLSYIGLDTSKPFDEQDYSEDMTWQDYFEQTTLEQLQQTYALLDDARSNGFEYDTADDYNDFLTTAKSTADENKITMRNYYKSMFGQYATAKNIKPFLENTYYANAYYDKLLEDNQPDEATAKDYYEEHKADYDKVSYYSFSFDPSNYTDEDPVAPDGSTDDEEAKETARTLAEKMQERLEDGEDFETLCAEYAPDSAKENYESTDSEFSLTTDIVCSSTNQVFREWMSEESRKEGDITMIASEDTGVCYVLKFVSRTYDETCLESISSTLSSDAASEYLDNLVDGNYEIADRMGKIGYLNTEEASEEESTAPDTESLLNTSVLDE